MVALKLSWFIYLITCFFAVVTALPFGGVGNSGVGAYRGKHSFDAFSHSKGVLSTGTGLEFLNK